MKAQDILRKSAQHIDDRAAARDQAEGERSMARTVAAFNALTGHQLSERDGWLFMVQLKMARACTTPTGIPDDYEDGASYVALAGECVAGNDNATAPRPYPKGTESMAVTHRPGDGNVLIVPPGYTWVAQDENGDWWAYDSQPSQGGISWLRRTPSERKPWALAHGEPNARWKETLRRVRD